jgi:putative IMPACT (imprinted ancient) family translation regulator
VTRPKKEAAVISRKKYLEEMGLMQAHLEDAKATIAQQKTLIEELQEDNLQISSSYANLKRESEMLYAQYKTTLKVAEEGIALRNERVKVLEDTISTLEKILNTKETPWYKKLFNSKSK